METLQQTWEYIKFYLPAVEASDPSAFGLAVLIVLIGAGTIYLLRTPRGKRVKAVQEEDFLVEIKEVVDLAISQAIEKGEEMWTKDARSAELKRIMSDAITGGLLEQFFQDKITYKEMQSLSRYFGRRCNLQDMIPASMNKRIQSSNRKLHPNKVELLKAAHKVKMKNGKALLGEDPVEIMRKEKAKTENQTI